MPRHAKPLDTRADLDRHVDRHNVQRLRHNIGWRKPAKHERTQLGEYTVPYMMPDGTVITPRGNKIRRIA